MVGQLRSDAPAVDRRPAQAFLEAGSIAITCGKLLLQVAVDGRSLQVQLPFVVFGGQKVFVKWAAPGTNVQVIHVGIIVDDGAPI